MPVFVRLKFVRLAVRKSSISRTLSPTIHSNLIYNDTLALCLQYFQLARDSKYRPRRRNVLFSIGNFIVLGSAHIRGGKRGVLATTILHHAALSSAETPVPILLGSRHAVFFCDEPVRLRYYSGCLRSRTVIGSPGGRFRIEPVM